MRSVPGLVRVGFVYCDSLKFAAKGGSFNRFVMGGTER